MIVAHQKNVYPDVVILALTRISSRNKLKIKFGIRNIPCQIPEYQVYSMSDCTSHRKYATKHDNNRKPSISNRITDFNFISEFIIIDF
jgi:hypothetical protein